LLKKHLLKSPVFVGPLYYSRRELSTKVRWRLPNVTKEGGLSC
jgi:hypothetical protein